MSWEVEKGCEISQCGNTMAIMITLILYLISIGGRGNQIRWFKEYVQGHTADHCKNCDFHPLGLMPNPHCFKTVRGSYLFWLVWFYCVTPDRSWVSWVLQSKTCLRAVVTCFSTGARQFCFFLQSESGPPLPTFEDLPSLPEQFPPTNAHIQSTQERWVGAGIWGALSLECQ